MKVFTIGFTKTTAERFFARIQKSGAKRILDVRLNNVSQLAGFAKRDDLRYFLRAICSVDYIHRPELAPTQELLDAYKKDGGAWPDYERGFLALMAKRRIEDVVPREQVEGACLLCSEDKPHHCHRRLVVEYLQGKWGDLSIEHL
jgi:uncharacterized protein (DUF488 family)